MYTELPVNAQDMLILSLRIKHAEFGNVGAGHTEQYNTWASHSSRAYFLNKQKVAGNLENANS